MKELLKETHMLDFNDSRIQSLIENRGWKNLEQFECIKAIYLYVRDEILFGYNIDDSISASKVLSDGYGQCNTKVLYLWRCLGHVKYHVGCMGLQ